jgi:hypothetical protein
MKKISVLVLILGALAVPAVFAEEGVVDKAGNGVKKGAEAADRGIQRGVEATEKGVKKGADATAEGFKKAGDWIETKMGKVKAKTD